MLTVRLPPRVLGVTVRPRSVRLAIEVLPERTGQFGAVESPMVTASAEPGTAFSTQFEATFHAFEVEPSQVRVAANAGVARSTPSGPATTSIASAAVKYARMRCRSGRRGPFVSERADVAMERSLVKPVILFAFRRGVVPDPSKRMDRSHHWLAPGCGDRTTPGGRRLPLPPNESVRTTTLRVKVGTPCGNATSGGLIWAERPFLCHYKCAFS